MSIEEQKRQQTLKVRICFSQSLSMLPLSLITSSLCRHFLFLLSLSLSAVNCDFVGVGQGTVSISLGRVKVTCKVELRSAFQCQDIYTFKGASGLGHDTKQRPVAVTSRPFKKLSSCGRNHCFVVTKGHMSTCLGPIRTRSILQFRGESYRIWKIRLKSISTRSYNVIVILCFVTQCRE